MYRFLNKKLQKGTIVYTTCTKKRREKLSRTDIN